MQDMYGMVRRFAHDTGITVREMAADEAVTGEGVSLRALNAVGLYRSDHRAIYVDRDAPPSHKAGAVLHELQHLAETGQAPESHRPLIRGLVTLATGAVAEQLATSAVAAVAGDAAIANMAMVSFSPAVQSVVYRLVDWLVHAYL